MRISVILSRVSSADKEGAYCGEKATRFFISVPSPSSVGSAFPSLPWLFSFPLLQHGFGRMAPLPSAATKPRVATGDCQGAWRKKKSLGTFPLTWHTGNPTELGIKHTVSSTVSNPHYFRAIGQGVYFYRLSIFSCIKQAGVRRWILREKIL